ncbi:thioesterase family protein [Tistrella bauzanensis]
MQTGNQADEDEMMAEDAGFEDIEAGRGVVVAGETDARGRMSAATITDRITDGAVFVLSAAGLGRHALSEQGLRLKVLASAVEIDEAPAVGEAWRLGLQPVPAEEGAIGFAAELVDPLFGDLMARGLVEVILEDAEGEPVSFPDDIADRLADAATEAAAPDDSLPAGCGVVATRHCDIMGHMNVQFYGVAFEQATRLLTVGLGLPEGGAEADAIGDPLQGGTTAGRCLSGDHPPDHGGAGCSGRDPRAAQYRDRRACGFGGICADPDHRRHRRHASLRRRDGGNRGDAGGRGAGRHRYRPRPHPTEGVRVETYRGSIDPWHCDENGLLSQQALIDRFSSGAGQLLGAIGLSGARIQTDRIGTAAVEYRVRYEGPARNGDALVLESQIAGVRDKVLILRHRLVRPGEEATPLLEIDVVAVMLDLEQRRATRVPADVTERARGLLVETEASAG